MQCQSQLNRKIQPFVVEGIRKPEMDKTLKNGVKYDWNKSPHPQMVGFCDLVGTGIAPVSTKTAVKY